VLNFHHISAWNYSSEHFVFYKTVK